MRYRGKLIVQTKTSPPRPASHGQESSLPPGSKARLPSAAMKTAVLCFTILFMSQVLPGNKINVGAWVRGECQTGYGKTMLRD